MAFYHSTERQQVAARAVARIRHARAAEREYAGELNGRGVYLCRRVAFFAWLELRDLGLVPSADLEAVTGGDAA
jgi:hypothetical protein